MIFAIVLAPLAGPIASIFSDDVAVTDLAAFVLIWVGISQPVGGHVFAIDGILIGAGDMRFLAIAMAGAAALFIPAALLVPALDLGIGWVWGAIWLLMVARAIPLLIRYRSDAWLVTGASS